MQVYQHKTNGETQARGLGYTTSSPSHNFTIMLEAILEPLVSLMALQRHSWSIFTLHLVEKSSEGPINSLVIPRTDMRDFLLEGVDC